MLLPLRSVSDDCLKPAAESRFPVCCVLAQPKASAISEIALEAQQLKNRSYRQARAERSAVESMVFTFERGFEFGDGPLRP
jgi:hypothetical protein